MKKLRSTIVVMVLLAIAGSAWGQDAESQPPAAAGEPLRVAVMDFAVSKGQDASLGVELADAVGAMLSMDDALDLVDRKTLEHVLSEQAMGMAGIVKPSDAVQVGQLAGAEFMVFGRVFPLAGDMVVTAKVVSVETTRVEGVLVKGKPAEMSDLMLEVAERLTTVVREKGPEMMAAAPAESEGLAGLLNELKGRKKPLLAVAVREEHTARRAGAAAPDPACETEIKHLLLKAGFDIVEVRGEKVADWTKQIREGGDKVDWSKNMQRVEVLVVGEAFSEYVGEYGKLVSCVARGEINVIRKADGKVLLADKATARMPDVQEQIAAKRALENVGGQLGLNVLKHFAATLPKAEGDAADDE